MKSRYIIGAVFIIAVVVIGIAVFESSGGQSGQYGASSSGATQANAGTGTTDTSAGSTATSTTSTTTAAQAYTMAQVATHNSATSCWSAINGKVYDLTNWINQHPGGPDHILSICGKDGSSAFNAQHGNDSRPQQILQTFYIGDLSS